MEEIACSYLGLSASIKQGPQMWLQWTFRWLQRPQLRERENSKVYLENILVSDNEMISKKRRVQSLHQSATFCTVNVNMRLPMRLSYLTIMLAHKISACSID
jgi:hypothetical protein